MLPKGKNSFPYGMENHFTTLDDLPRMLQFYYARAELRNGSYVNAYNMGLHAITCLQVRLKPACSITKTS